MRYIFYYKMLYIALLFLNIIILAFRAEGFYLDSYLFFIATHGFILLIINLYNFWKIKSLKVSSFIYNFEIAISCYRLGGVALVATFIFGRLVVTFSPLTYSVWQPALDLFKLDGGNYYWWLLLLLMFSLEFRNLFLLRKNKEALGSNLAKNVQ